MSKYIYIFCGSAVITWIIYPSYIDIRCNDYSSILQALLNISSIVFAIIGAWIAIIYPKAISQTFGKSDIKNGTFQHDANYLSELVEIVLVSAAVLMYVLIVQFSMPLFKNCHFVQTYRTPLMVVFFQTMAYMTLVQLYAIFRVILANYHFLNELRAKNTNDAIDEMHK